MPPRRPITTSSLTAMVNARRKRRRSRVARFVNAILPLLPIAGLIALTLWALQPAPNVMGIRPQELAIVMTSAETSAQSDGDDVGDEIDDLQVTVTYQGTATGEWLSLNLPNGTAETITIYFAQGALSQEEWTCQAYGTGDAQAAGNPESFRPIDDDGLRIAEFTEARASGFPLSFNVDDPEWTRSLQLSVADDRIRAIQCSRSGDLWPFISATYRTFVPPVITIAAPGVAQFDLTTERDLWFAGEAEATEGISHFGSDEIQAVTDGPKNIPARWRDQPLALHDTTVQIQVDALLFFIAALLGALVPSIPKLIAYMTSAASGVYVDRLRAPRLLKRYLRLSRRSRRRRARR